MESIVLLENQNGILPMDLSKYKSVAIIGPCADDPICSEGNCTSILHACTLTMHKSVTISLLQVTITLDQSTW